jgi:hypothetical protein
MADTVVGLLPPGEIAAPFAACGQPSGFHDAAATVFGGFERPAN